MGIARLEANFILDMAAREFAEHGFEGMSMRVLADKCSVTASALYYHFSSKEALYDEACQQIFDNMIAAVDRALIGAQSPEERMERLVSTIFDEWGNNTPLLLTERDVINATIAPERSFASPHYAILFGLIHKIQAQHFKDEIDESLSFAIGALIYGYCSLLAYTQHKAGISPEDQRLKRKMELLAFCKDFMRSRRRAIDTG